MATPLPDDDDLNQMAQSIAGCDYVNLAPEHRVLVMQLAIANEKCAAIFELENGIRPIAEWFEKSRLYEP